MRKDIYKKIKCFTLAITLVMGLMSAFPAGIVSKENDISEVYAEGATRVSDTEKETFEKTANPFVLNSFGEMYDAGQLKISDTLGGTAVTSDETGLHISAKNGLVKKSAITIRKLYDFGTMPQEGVEGSKRMNRVMIDGVAKYFTNTRVKFFIDEETLPFAETRLPSQTEKGDWSLKNTAFAEVPDKIYGEHYITIVIEDKTTKDDKKTEVLLRGIKFYKESVPTVYVNIDESLGTIADMNNDMTHSTNCYGDITITVPEGYYSGYGDVAQTAATAGTYRLEDIRGRGNSTWREDVTKRPYKLKLDDKADLFGMGKNKHWALMANFYDNSLIRNRITYMLGEAMGMAYTPKLVPVDVVMNGEYLGSYFLSEVVRVDETRVNIDDMEDLKETDIQSDPDWMTGGYLLELSPYKKETIYKFTTQNDISCGIASPEEMTDAPDRLDEANHYIKDYIQKTENAIFSDNFTDEYGKSYKDYIDIESAAKYFLFQCFTANIDGYKTSSSKLYKEKNGKLYYGPLWDFDYVAWGATDYTGIIYSSESECMTDPWIERFKSDPEFISLVKEYWNGNGDSSLKAQLEKIIADGGMIDQYERELELSAENNFDKTNMTAFPLGAILADPGDNGEKEVIICNNFHDEIARLKKWINARITYVDGYMETIQDDYEYTVVKFYNEGELVKQYNMRADGGIKVFPELAPRDGYYFLGWYAEAELYDEITYEPYMGEKLYQIGDYVEASELILNAKWAKTEDVQAPDDIYFLQDEIYISTNEYTNVPISVCPENAISTVTVTSSNDELVEIGANNMLITNDKTGEATITATTINGKQAELKVHVAKPGDEEQSINDFYIETANILLEKGQYEKVVYHYEPQDYIGFSFKIVNSDPDIAYMTDAGVVVAKSKGTTRIFITVGTGEYLIETYIDVTVTDIAGDKAQEEKEAEEAKKKAEEEKKAAKKAEEEKEAEIKKRIEEETEKLKAENGKNGKNTVSKKSILKKNTIFTYKNIRYMVIKPCKIVDGNITGGKLTVYGGTSKFKNSGKMLRVPDTIEMNNNTFTVVSVRTGAFKNYKKLSKVILGTNVTKVGANAFNGCKNLKSITIKNKGAAFGKNAFKNVSPKIKANVPEAAFSKLKKRLKKAGITKVQMIQE